MIEILLKHLPGDDAAAVVDDSHAITRLYTRGLISLTVAEKARENLAIWIQAKLAQNDP